MLHRRKGPGSSRKRTEAAGFHLVLKPWQNKAVLVLVQVYLKRKCHPTADVFGRRPAECASLFHHPHYKILKLVWSIYCFLTRDSEILHWLNCRITISG